MSRNPIARVIRQIRPQIVQDKRHREVDRAANADLVESACPVCGDHHDSGNVPLGCETGDGE